MLHVNGCNFGSSGNCIYPQEKRAPRYQMLQLPPKARAIAIETPGQKVAKFFEPVIDFLFQLLNK